jgi:hypothetical protein
MPIARLRALEAEDRTDEQLELRDEDIGGAIVDRMASEVRSNC